MTRRRGIAFIDGNYIKTDDAKISVFDLGFERSDVVYDVISTWKDLFFRLDDHLDRFLRSAGGFRLSCPYNRDEIKYILAECTSRAGLRDAYVKMALTAGHYTGPERLDYRATTPAFFAFAIPYLWIANPEKQEDRPQCSHCFHTPHPRHMRGRKLQELSLGRLDPSAERSAGCRGRHRRPMWHHWKAGRGSREATSLSGKAESSSPRRPTACAGLHGWRSSTWRNLWGSNLKPAIIRPAVLREADEAFLSSTAGGIMPLTRVDGKPLGDGKPGRRTMELRDLYWSKREAGWLGTPIEGLLRPEPTTSGRERIHSLRREKEPT